MIRSPIIIIDDDIDDTALIREAFDELKCENEIIVFHDSASAFQYLEQLKQKPFFILCDINMVRLNGLELRQLINENEKLRLLAIPFLFWSTSGSSHLVNQAYSLNIQGFFKKPDSIQEIKKMISIIMKYWDCSDRPLN